MPFLETSKNILDLSAASKKHRTTYHPMRRHIATPTIY